MPLGEAALDWNGQSKPTVGIQPLKPMEESELRRGQPMEGEARGEKHRARPPSREVAAQVNLCSAVFGTVSSQHGGTAVQTENLLPGVQGFQRISEQTGATAQIHPEPWGDALPCAVSRESAGDGPLQGNERVIAA